MGDNRCEELEQYVIALREIPCYFRIFKELKCSYVSPETVSENKFTLKDQRFLLFSVLFKYYNDTNVKNRLVL